MKKINNYSFVNSDMKYDFISAVDETFLLSVHTTYIIYVMLIVCDKAALTCTYLCWISLGLFLSHVGVITCIHMTMELSLNYKKITFHKT